MAVHGGDRGWSDLPDDLLSTIYLGFTSAYDRARFAAVCTSWRGVAACHPRLPALPLLLPPTGDVLRDLKVRAYSPENGRPLRVPLPWFSPGTRLVGSYDDGWVVSASASNELLVVNLFSNARTAALSAKQRFVVCACETSFWGPDAAYVRKIVFSANPSSSSCILAAITRQCYLAICRVGFPGGGWTTQGCGTIAYKDLVDITFCNGDLYGFTDTELLKFDIDMNRDGALVANPIHLLDMGLSGLYLWGVNCTTSHIFELRGKLAIAVKVFPETGRLEDCFIKVFDLVQGDIMWEEVTSLGDHALFLGQASSKAVHLSMLGQRGAVEGNRIYYSENQFVVNKNVERLSWLDIGSWAVQSWESKGTHHLEKILSRGYHSYQNENSNNSCIWLLPPNL